MFHGAPSLREGNEEVQWKSLHLWSQNLFTAGHHSSRVVLLNCKVLAVLDYCTASKLGPFGPHHEGGVQCMDSGAYTVVISVPLRDGEFLGMLHSVTTLAQGAQLIKGA